jgi:uncharacterized ferredoxin-like protein
MRIESSSQPGTPDMSTKFKLYLEAIRALNEVMATEGLTIKENSELHEILVKLYRMQDSELTVGERMSEIAESKQPRLFK